MLALPVLALELILFIVHATATSLTLRAASHLSGDQILSEGASVVFTPPPQYEAPKTLYSRVILLQSGKLLATCEVYPRDEPYFPIFESSDSGETWWHLSDVYDTKNGWGNRYQPFLLQLGQDFASFPAGTILLAGNSVPRDHNYTQLNLYASMNEGKTWSFVSTIANGGRAFPDNGETPVWEPFLLLYNNELLCFYSDQRDPAHGQKLVHQGTTDGVAWGPVVTDFASPVYKHRPGMPVVTRKGNGDFVMTFEFFGARQANFAAYYMIASTPHNFSAANAHVVKAPGFQVPTSSPYVVWSPHIGAAGALIVSAASTTSLFLLENGRGQQWRRVGTDTPSGYSRSMTVLPNAVILASAGPLHGKSNSFQVNRLPL